MSTPFEINSTYSFNTLAPAILGASFDWVVLESYMNLASASKEFPHITSRYRQVYPSLPTGTPDRPNNTTYYVFRTLAGEAVCLAQEWIDMTSVTKVIATQWDVRFQGGVADMERVRAFMAVTGLTFTINQTS